MSLYQRLKNLWAWSTIDPKNVVHKSTGVGMTNILTIKRPATIVQENPVLKDDKTD